MHRCCVRPKGVAGAAGSRKAVGGRYSPDGLPGGPTFPPGRSGHFRARRKRNGAGLRLRPVLSALGGAAFRVIHQELLLLLQDHLAQLNEQIAVLPHLADMQSRR
jgi:hypothetical protein